MKNNYRFYFNRNTFLVKNLLFFIFLSQITLAQNNYGQSFWQQKGLQTGVYAYGNLASSAYDKHFINHFIQGGFIDENNKTRNYNRIKSEKITGFDVDAAIWMNYTPDSLFGVKGLGIFGSVGQRLQGELLNTSDAFRLVFFGNQEFIDKDAALAPFKFQTLNYQQIRLGLSFNEGKGGFAFSYLNASSFQELELNNGLFYTAQNTDFLKLTADGYYLRSDTAKQNFLTHNGGGFSFDAFYNFKLDSLNKHRLMVEVRDFGILFFNNKSLETRFDTNYRFNGIEINNLLNPDVEKSIDDLNTDSLQKNLSVNKKNRLTKLLPYFLHFNYQYQFSEKLILGAGLRHRFESVFLTQIYASANYRIKENFHLLGNINYGGYGRLGLGLGIKTLVLKHYQFQLFSDNIESLVLPKQSFGQSVFIAISRRF